MTTTSTPIPTALGADAAAEAAKSAQTADTAGTGSAPKTTGAEGFGMDKDAFLKILVEQMRHQDPSQPGDSQQYIEQMTQFSILEQLTNISEHSQVQSADAAAASAINLVGHDVTYAVEGEDGKPVDKTGVVKGVDFSTGAPLLTIGDDEQISLGAVKEVR